MRMVEGYELKRKLENATYSFFASLLYNAHVHKASARITSRDLMRVLHPKTRLERQREEALFMAEYQAEQERGE